MSYESTRTKRLNAKVSGKPCILHTPLGDGVYKTMSRDIESVYGKGPDNPPTDLIPGPTMYEIDISGVVHKFLQTEIDELN